MEHTVPFIFQWDETFDVGMDTGTPAAAYRLIALSLRNAVVGRSVRTPRAAAIAGILLLSLRRSSRASGGAAPRGQLPSSAE